MKKLIAMLVGSLFTFGANAATVSYNFANPLVTTEISQTGNLGLFDSNLGTLTGATLVVNGGSQMTFSGTNSASQTQIATITSSVELFWASSLATLNAFLLDSILMSATSGAQTYAVGETKSFGPFTANGSSTDDLASVLGALQLGGGGQFSVTCNSASGLSIRGGGGNISSSQSTSAQCGASIVYTYDEVTNKVPEPGSLALVGLAIIGYLSSRRRIRA